MMTCLKLVLAAALAAIVIAPASVHVQDDGTYILFEEGRAAFQAGLYDIARQKLNRVKAKNPGHLPTQSLLAKIEQKIGPDNAALRKAYAEVIIEQVEFTDVTLDEAVEAVRILSRKASNNQVSPNIIIKSPELGKKTLTVKLTKVPLPDLLKYLAELTGAKITIDKTAVMFSSPAG